MDETHILDKRKFIKNYIKTQASHEVTTEIITILNKTGVVHSKNQNGYWFRWNDNWGQGFVNLKEYTDGSMRGNIYIDECLWKY